MSKGQSKLQSQARVVGVRRERLSLSAERAIDKAVRAEARHFGCSMSFVLAVCAADALGVPLGSEARYRPSNRVLRVIQGGRDRHGKRIGARKAG